MLSLEADCINIMAKYVFQGHISNPQVKHNLQCGELLKHFIMGKR